MFKKIEIWILYLVIWCAIVFAIFFGVLVRQEIEGSVKFGLFSKGALFLAKVPMNVKKIFQKVKDPGIDSSVGSRFPGKIGFKGISSEVPYYLLLSRYNGDLSESTVELIDLKSFKIIHTWNPKINEINNLIDTEKEEYKNLKRNLNEQRYLIQSPIVNDKAELIFHENGSALKKIDSCNNLIWINDKFHFHHMSEEDFEGNYWIPSRIFPFSLSKEMVGENYGDFFDDAITKISDQGKVLFQKSVAQIFLENNLDYLLFTNQIFNGDPIHLNDIQPTKENTSYWKKGDIFLSLRSQSMIILYRPSEEKIIEIITGPFINQHDVDIISEKEISIFNNNTFFYKGKRIKGGNLHFEGNAITKTSEVLIYNFETRRFKKKFENGLKMNDVNTSVQGLAEIVNEKLFIEESQSGRLLFFDKKGKLLWEYVNKAKNQKNYILGFSKLLYDNVRVEKILKALKKNKCQNY